MGYVVMIAVIAVFLVGYTAFFHVIYSVFPSLYGLFHNNTIAFGIFIFSGVTRIPAPFCAVIALIAGIIFADVWYAPAVQYIAMEIIFALISWVIFGVFAGGAYIGGGLYDKLKLKERFNNNGLIDMLKPWFTFKGRISRKTFIMRYILALIILGVTTVICLYCARYFRIIAVVVGILAIISVAWLIWANTNRRFHDMGKSSKWTWGLFLTTPILERLGLREVASIVGLLFFIYLACKKGTAGNNEYGPDPLQKSDIQEEISTEESWAGLTGVEKEDIATIMGSEEVNVLNHQDNVSYIEIRRAEMIIERWGKEIRELRAKYEEGDITYDEFLEGRKNINNKFFVWNEKQT